MAEALLLHVRRVKPLMCIQGRHTEQTVAAISIRISQTYCSVMQGAFDEQISLQTQRGEGEAEDVTQHIINNG